MSWGRQLAFNGIDDFSDSSETNIQKFSTLYSYRLALPFITGRYFNFTYGQSTNFDFKYLYITPSNRMKAQNETIIFKHNHINNRELYEVKTLDDRRR